MTETPQFGILKSLKEPLRGLTRWGSQLSQSAELTAYVFRDIKICGGHHAIKKEC